jgi:hypothetical protein
MDWDQIENKWAAMTRRVRADWSSDKAAPKGPQARRPTRTDTKPVVIADRHTGTADDRLKMPVE